MTDGTQLSRLRGCEAKRAKKLSVGRPPRERHCRSLAEEEANGWWPPQPQELEDGIEAEDAEKP